MAIYIYSYVLTYGDRCALEAGRLVTLEKVDNFVDGAAVARIGDLNFDVLRPFPAEDVVIVPEDRLCGTMIEMLNIEGVVLEPAGALAIDARVVGVNARDLGTFDEDLGVGEQLAAIIPPEVVAVAESAIRSRADAARMAASGFDAILVGELLVKSADPAGTVRELASIERVERGE